MNAAFRCEHCGKLLSAQGDARSHFRCPGCGALVEVPPALAAMPHPRPAGAIPAVGAASASQAGDTHEQVSARLGTIERVMPFVLSFCFHLGLVTVTLFLGTVLIERKEAPAAIPSVPSVGFQMEQDAKQPPELGADAKHPGPGPGLVDAPYAPDRRARLTPPMARPLVELASGNGKPARKGERLNLIGLGGLSGDPSGDPNETGLGLGHGPVGPTVFGVPPVVRDRIGDPNGGGLPPGWRRGRLAQHIVFVVDRSGSMVDTFDAVRQEMYRAIGLMDPNRQDFHVILFSDGAPLEPADQRLVPPTPDYLATVTRFLMKTPASGPTDPLPALARAFEVLEKARGTKVIYLLTDSQFPDSQKVLQFLRQRNPKGEVCIHTLLYGGRSAEAEETMRTISKENGRGISRQVTPE